MTQGQKPPNLTPGSSPRLLQQGTILPFILLSSCFMWWGIANNMTDPLVKVFQSIFEDLTTFRSSLIQFAFYGGYFCLAIPGAIIARKYSYKVGVLTGLGMYAAGCFLLIPARFSLTFESFLIAFWVLAAGLSILETNANPYILSLGPPETATRRLNLAQSFNPLGSIVGILLAAILIMEKLKPWEHPDQEAEKAFLIPVSDQGETLAIVIFPYLVIAVVLVAIWLMILFAKMPHMAEPEKLHFAQTYVRLMRNSNYVYAVVAQFFYVGAQITVWTYTNYYVPDQLPSVKQGDVLLHYHIIALILFGVFRFVFTWLMKYFRDYNLLLAAAVLGAIFTLNVVFVGGRTGVYSLIAISACMSLMFPTIFGLGSRGLGADTKVGASGLIMAILGGAIITPLQGAIIDLVKYLQKQEIIGAEASAPSVSYLVPLVCFIVIGAYAIYSGKVKVSHPPAVLQVED